MIKYFSAFSGIGGFELGIGNKGTCVGCSEIDEYALKIYKKHFPEHKNFGDITKINKIPKHDLFVGGFPCQPYSSAGQRKGFDDPRAKAFLTMLRLIKKYRPKHIILENVASMGKEMQNEITAKISNAINRNIMVTRIDSALVSAQTRKRIFWTTFPVEQPVDKKIFLKDIIEHGAVDRMKSYAIDCNYYKGSNLTQYIERARRQLVFIRKANARILRNLREEGQKGWCLSATAWKGMQANGMTSISDKGFIRKLTPLECERLQTFPDNWTEGISNTRRYKALGNAVTVNAIKHIMSNY